MRKLQTEFDKNLKFIDDVIIEKWRDNRMGIGDIVAWGIEEQVTGRTNLGNAWEVRARDEEGDQEAIADQGLLQTVPGESGGKGQDEGRWRQKTGRTGKWGFMLPKTLLKMIWFVSCYRKWKISESWKRNSRRNNFRKSHCNIQTNTAKVVEAVEVTAVMMIATMTMKVMKVILKMTMRALKANPRKRIRHCNWRSRRSYRINVKTKLKRTQAQRDIRMLSTSVMLRSSLSWRSRK